MFFSHSLRWRLQIWHGLILLAVLGGFGLTAWRLEQERILTAVSERLTERHNNAMRLMRQAGPPDGGDRPRGGPGPEGGPPPRGNPPPREAAGPGGSEGRPNHGPPGRAGPPARYSPALEAALKAGEIPGSSTSVWRRDGLLIATTKPDRNLPIPPKKTGDPGVVRNGNQMSLLGSTPPGDVVLVTRDIAPELAILHRSAWQLGAAGLTILGLGLAGGWWAGGRSLQPLAAMTATADHLSAGNLGERLPVADSGDELGQLATVLNAMLGRLDSAFTQQTRFISDAAHELRTPVTVMLTQTQTALLRERPAAEYRASLEACQRAATRMRRLIESLLALARLDAGDQVMKRLRFDFAHAVSEQVELLTPLAAARNITFHHDLPPLAMEGDPDYLTLVAANLLTNAIHYNRDGGEIRVTLQREAEAAVLTVTDTGEGMAPAALARIFDRFYRVDHSRSLPAGRTGLGLAITKSIVEAHRGTITVESTPGTGTSFTVRLPVT